MAPPASALDARCFGEYLERCESLGFDTIWLSDIPLGPAGDPIVDLGFAAAVTSKLKLGANIVPLGRNPLGLAKQLAQLDRLSRGRLLLTFVPGLGTDAERAALGTADRNRGRVLEDVLGLVRRWWAGESVTATHGALAFEDVSLGTRPVQDPLEVWLGGRGPLAIERVGRCGEGWLAAFVTPSEAQRGREEIERHAASYGRRVDPEHFGVSLLAARSEPDPQALAGLRGRRDEGELRRVLPVGAAATRELTGAYREAGLSKFVVRLLESGPAGSDWRGDLDWLAETLLPLQT